MISLKCLFIHNPRRNAKFVLTISPLAFFESWLFLRRMRGSADVFRFFAKTATTQRMQCFRLEEISGVCKVQPWLLRSLSYASRLSRCAKNKMGIFSEEFARYSRHFFHSSRFLKTTSKAG